MRLAALLGARRPRRARATPASSSAPAHADGDAPGGGGAPGHGARALGVDATASSAAACRLLDPATLAPYGGLGLVVRGGMGMRQGERRFPGHPQPSGTEIEAYGAYAPGDDLRHLDWNAAGRLDALLMRRYTAEREVHVHLLVDCSGSMGAPAADDKLGTAARLAIALAYMAIAGSDAVRVVLLADGGDARASALTRQRSRMARLAELLAAARPRGALALGAALESYAHRHPRAGAAFVLSDLMTDPADVEHGIQALRARDYEVHLLHVIGRRELDPARHFGDAVLVDAESDATHPMTLDAATLARYHALLAAHLAALAAVADRTATTYARLVSDGDVVAFVTGELARRGLVRRR